MTKILVGILIAIFALSLLTLLLRAFFQGTDNEERIEAEEDRILEEIRRRNKSE